MLDFPFRTLDYVDALVGVLEQAMIQYGMGMPRFYRSYNGSGFDATTD